MLQQLYITERFQISQYNFKEFFGIQCEWSKQNKAYTVFKHLTFLCFDHIRKYPRLILGPIDNV